jgi:hypothetical protein
MEHRLLYISRNIEHRFLDVSRNAITIKINIFMTKFKIIMFILAAGLCLASCKEDKEELLKPTLKLNRDMVTFETDLTGTATFEVNCNVAWKVHAYQGWLTVTPESGDGKSVVVVTITASDNNDGDAREGIVEVVAGDLKEQITVSQSKTVTLTFSKTEAELEDVIMPAATAVVTVTSNVDWELSSKSDWLTVTPSRGLASTKPVVLTISTQMNSTSGVREGEFVLKTETREFVCKVRQKKGEDRFFGSSDTIYLSDKGSDGTDHYRFFRFTSSAPWTATVDGDFVMDQTTGEGSLLIKVYPKSENNSGGNRIGKITFTAGDRKLEVPVVQGWVGNYWEDGDLKVMNQHTKGLGVPIVVMGDGYDREDLKKGGWWETMGGIMAEEIMDADVVRNLLEYLDVYLLMSESPERGVLYPDYPRNRTRFGAYGADENQGMCEEFARAVVEEKGVTDQTVLGNDVVRITFLANGPYPGNATNPMARGGIWEDGYGYWAVHEFVGHVLSDLPDMYWSGCDFPTTGDGTEPAPGEDGGITWSIAREHPNHNCWFIDWRTDPTQVVWKDFIGKEGYTGPNNQPPSYRYDSIGIFPTTFGGMFCDDLWGPCQVTCMREYYLCFDLGSRFQVYNKILERAGIQPPVNEDDPTDLRSLAAFMEFDKKRNETCKDCRQGWGTGDKKFSWSQYCSATGKLMSPGDYDSFWQRLWPPKGSACQ